MKPSFPTWQWTTSFSVSIQIWYSLLPGGVVRTQEVSTVPFPLIFASEIGR